MTDLNESPLGNVNDLKNIKKVTGISGANFAELKGRTRRGNCSQGNSRLYRLGVSHAQKPRSREMSARGYALSVRH